MFCTPGGMRTAKSTSTNLGRVTVAKRITLAIPNAYSITVVVGHARAPLSPVLNRSPGRPRRPVLVRALAAHQGQNSKTKNRAPHCHLHVPHVRPNLTLRWMTSNSGSGLFEFSWFPLFF